MNDAERDAWLREALRHAPDSDALPPSGVSEAILLKARAAARVGASARRRAATGVAPPANPLAAFWAWLARPPVAAGFASVMAATLVGLMWWDRPMDETTLRSRALVRDHADTAAQLAAPATAAAPPAATAPAPTEAPGGAADVMKAMKAMKPTTPARSETAATADDREALRRLKSAPEQSTPANAQVADPATAAAKRQVEPLAKERAPTAERKNEAPAPFPSHETQRETLAAAAPKSLDAAPTDAKKDAGAGRSRATDALDRAAVPPAAQAVAPTPPAPRPPAAAPAPTSPLASGLLAGDESRPAGAMQSETAKAKSAVEAAPAPFRNELERASPDSTTRGAAAKQSTDPATRADTLARAGAATRTAPLTPLLAAIAADPERWSRQAASGDTVALDAGWRAWLAELDAAAAGRWRPLGGVTASADGAAARDGTTTLRLVSAGRVVAVVRSDGATVQVDASPGTGADRWQATLSPDQAERLRTTARRLPP